MSLGSGFSPSHLAMGLTPMAVPHSPTRKAQSPPLGPEKSRSHRSAWAWGIDPSGRGRLADHIHGVIYSTIHMFDIQYI